MPRRSPPYSPQFRADTVRRLRSGDATIAELARELDVSEQTLRRWRRQVADRSEAVVGPVVRSPDPTAGASEVAGGRREPRMRGASRPMRRFAGLAAGTIEVGVVVVTAPATWAAGALRRYADR